MLLKLFDLNIWTGSYLPEIFKYVRGQRPDIITFQEVTGGQLSKYGNNCYHDCEKEFHMQSRLTNPTILDKDHSSFLGNATFVRNDFEIVSENVIWLRKFEFLKTGRTIGDRNVPDDPRNALSLKLKIGNSFIYIINTHFAWGITPFDEPYKILQMAVLRDYVQSLDTPFILIGDFNMVADTHVVRSLSELGTDLTSDHRLITTLNPRTHYLGQQVTDNKLAVDHCIVHKDILVKLFQVVDTPDLSDHCGLLLVFEV